MTALNSSAPVRVVARVLAQPDKIPMAGKILQTLMIQSRRESGCLQYDVLQNRDDPADFTTVEHWQDQTCLDRHFQTPHFQTAVAQLAALLQGEGDIRFYRLIEENNP
ncbi:MAG: putative quinol monooxygenase [Cyanobacteriota bacterium]|jgi:quinol monooxygenase YgiN|nr:putative quinol monooxygenase [Cyanobacteriota bacterium]